MGLDLSQISPKGRARYLRIGRGFGSTDTLKQAKKTLAALSEHGAALVDRGFAVEDGEKLAVVHDSLVDAGVGREGKAGEKKTTSKAYLAAFGQAKTARTRAHAVLSAAHRTLEDASEEESAIKIESALSLKPGIYDCVRRRGG